MPPMRRGRRPVAKAAVVGGAGAYAGKKAGEKKGRQKAEAEQGATAAAAGPGGKDDALDQLKKLSELRDSGVLTTPAS